MKDVRDRLRLRSPDEQAELPLLRPFDAKVLAVREDDLRSISIPRHETRITNMREDERHRLKSEEAIVTTVEGERIIVDLVNLSGGGAMIGCEYEPEDLEPMLLDLGDGGEIEAAVRWVKNKRIGLEFAQETQFGCDAQTRDAVLLDTIRRSFPTANLDGMAHSPSVFTPKTTGESADRGQRGTRRHPLIWFGNVHYDHDTHPVRIRNISENGALIEAQARLPVDAGLLLDLAEAGEIFAFVSWSRGGQAGLRFEEAFNVSRLAETRPQLRSDWQQPDYLVRHQSQCDAGAKASPWASHWDSPSLEHLREDLEGYLKY